jgi:hypothetical protein
MSNATKLSATEFFVPDHVLSLFGDPPLLRGEDDSRYYAVMEQFTKMIEPKDIMYWWWVKDMTDHTWEIRRLRRFKVLVVELRRDRAIKHREGFANIATAHGFDKSVAVPESEKDSAEFFSDRIDQYKDIDKLIASAELRRDRTLREIERRRESFARQLRKASDNMAAAEDNVTKLHRAA